MRETELSGTTAVAGQGQAGPYQARPAGQSQEEGDIVLGQAHTTSVTRPNWDDDGGSLVIGEFTYSAMGEFVASAELELLWGHIGGPDVGVMTAAGLLEFVADQDKPTVGALLSRTMPPGSRCRADFGVRTTGKHVLNCRLRATWGKEGLLAGVLMAKVPAITDQTDQTGRSPSESGVLDLSSARDSSVAQHRRLTSAGAVGLAGGTDVLQEEARRYQALIELSPDIIVVFEAGQVLWANPAARRWVGPPEGLELVGQPVLSLFSAQSGPRFLARTLQLVQTGETGHFSEEQMVRSDGTLLDVEAVPVITTWSGRQAFEVIARVITDRKQAELKLREQAALIDAVAEAIIVTEGADYERLRVASWSKGAERAYGWSDAAAVGCLLVDLLATDQQEGAEFFKEVVSSGRAVREVAHTTKSGATLYAHESVTATYDCYGTVAGAIFVVTDITASKLAEAHHSAVVSALDEGVVVIGPDTRIESANVAAEAMFGTAPGGLTGHKISDLDRAVVDEAGMVVPPERWPCSVVARTGQAVTGKVLGLLTPTSETWVSMNCRPLSGPALGHSGGPTRVVCSMSDITEAKRAKDIIAHEASHDPLTGLLNRPGAMNELTALLSAWGATGHDLHHGQIGAGAGVDQGAQPSAVASSAPEPYAMDDAGASAIDVMVVDIDRFQAINDSYGHNAGDKVLQVVAKRLLAWAERLHTTDAGPTVLARLGADEFMVVPSTSSPRPPQVLAGELRDLFAGPFVVEDGSGARHVVKVTASVGANRLEPGHGGQDALAGAQAATATAKAQGGARAEVFSEALAKELSTRRQVARDLKEALMAKQLYVAYQPIVATDGEVAGYEALARWQHPTMGHIPPDQFIKVAEETGLVVPLGRFVLETAVQDALKWREGGHRAYVSVNLSAKQLVDPALVATVAEVLRSTGLPPGALWLEVTESSLIEDIVAASVVLSDLKALGVHLSLDDFGKGFSSLYYLSSLPVDALKIDQDFVRYLGTEDRRSAIVGSTVTMAHDLGLSVVAEGVETTVQSEILAGMGADRLQGFLFGRPGPAPHMQDKGLPGQVRAAGKGAGSE